MPPNTTLKRICFVLAMALWISLRAAPVFAQGSSCGIASPCQGNITVVPDAVNMSLPANTGTIFVTVAGASSWTGTLQFQQSGDGGATYGLSSCTPQPSGTAVTSTTLSGHWRCLASGLTNFQVIATATISGKAAVTISASAASAGSGGTTGTAGGDLSGSYPNPTVAGINGAAVPASKTCLGSNGSSQLIDASSLCGGTITATGTPAANDFSYWTSATNLTKVTTPTTKGTWYPCYVLTSDAAVAPTDCLLGFSNPRAVTGTTATDTILYSDNGGRVVYQGSVAVAVALPTATTMENSHFAVLLVNNTTGAATAVTVTPTTWSFTSPAATPLIILQGQSCRITVDAAGSAWDADCWESGLTAGTGITLIRAAGWLTVSAPISFGATFDGGGSPLAAATAYVTVQQGCTIASTDSLIDTGSATFTFWDLATGSTALPTAANIISNAGILLNSGHSLHTTASDFTVSTGTAVTALDKIGIHIVPDGTATWAQITVRCN